MMMSGFLLAVSALLLPRTPPVTDRARSGGSTSGPALIRAEDTSVDQAPGDNGMGTLSALIDEIRWEQVRIEQRLIIRIAPGGPRPDPFRDIGPPAVVRLREKKSAKCLSVSGIFGSRPVSDSRLVLFMRDRRLMGADLDRMCNARDFYSGFYVESASDGQLCAKRDTIHSRAGTTCTIARLHELEP